ncbi:ExbD/TolR family protein [Aestuariirhabdus litorea]|uniref:Biopolymer transporter ExbD n=1 Tax=Aestuariirhabdus litorea TaxID=2528527 RepID=A0A3P3VNT0_9GAMM|nr:biopolymer transporter ExbD [Aestuariirhabdus litorea]RRJ84270.1 biopolymer transporter ExbD [Aestuariirhabdus litorea]RWW97492.1 biopolymer transporter ExbD [Endozoicomonadaceae bacterium GTF-13]
MRRRRLRRQQGEPEINITAFLNLMVVLIPFLLMSAAFNQLTAFDLFLPTDSSAQATQTNEEEKVELAVLLRKEKLVLNVHPRGQVAELPHSNEGALDIPGLQQQLRSLKAKYTDMTQITLLSEPDTRYETIIEVMDGVRAMSIEEAGSRYRIELFPDIALGDAPETGA